MGVIFGDRIVHSGFFLPYNLLEVLCRLERGTLVAGGVFAAGFSGRFGGE
ncbi:MAG: hypothetical protein QG599_141 [Pseudomonadota bacterium]|nr:hypothetical protein [Pseudomonadota bacterium]